MKQTAVEWLFKWMIDNKDLIIEERLQAFEQAKEMEKAEKIKAQIEAVRAVDTYGLIHMLKYYEQQLKSE
jgi:hypothetical protein